MYGIMGRLNGQRDSFRTEGSIMGPIWTNWPILSGDRERIGKPKCS
jgi:hypothetical protein